MASVESEGVGWGKERINLLGQRRRSKHELLGFVAQLKSPPENRRKRHDGKPPYF
ncbi:hypothetical protein FH972_027306 [Carpinus fangiana]|uniref:Uncharacterized protein n=1 Tax=Carpinus fangiana TaxID=176857 RepID=A0A5N6N373_9ROSI|nr:hypothetical protein FH972_027306 [Carpinus fangiana]